MKLIRNAFVGGLLAGPAAIVACSGQLAPTSTASGGSDGPSSGSTTTGWNTGSSPGVSSSGSTTVSVNTGSGSTSIGANTGSVETVLVVPNDGRQVQSFSYEISGGPASSSGSFTEPTGDAGLVEWVSGGIVAGCGYTVTVTGEDPWGNMCSGSSVSFCVLPEQLSSVSMRLACTVPADTGLPILDASPIAIDSPPSLVGQGPYTCPGIASFTVEPAEILGSQAAALNVTTVGNSAGTIVWTDVWSDGSVCPTDAPAGFFGPDGGATSSGNSVSFSCAGCTGAVVLTAQAQLDIVPAGQDASTNVCEGVQFTSYSANIVCENGASGDACDGGVCTAP